MQAVPLSHSRLPDLAPGPAYCPENGDIMPEGPHAVCVPLESSRGATVLPSSIRWYHCSVSVNECCQSGPRQWGHRRQ